MSEYTPPLQIPDPDGHMATVLDRPGWRTLRPDDILQEGDSWAYITISESSDLAFWVAAIPRLNAPNQGCSLVDLGQTVASRQCPPNPPGWWPFRVVDRESAEVLEGAYDQWLADQEAAVVAEMGSKRHQYTVTVLPLP